jgi:hypothetical protein
MLTKATEPSLLIDHMFTHGRSKFRVRHRASQTVNLCIARKQVLNMMLNMDVATQQPLQLVCSPSLDHDQAHSCRPQAAGWHRVTISMPHMHSITHHPMPLYHQHTAHAQHPCLLSGLP